MRLVELELRRIRLPLIAPFRSALGTEAERDILLVRIAATTTDWDGEGWSECVALMAPTYTSEFVDSAQLVISEFLWPTLASQDTVDADQVGPLLAPFVGHEMAKAALEMAVLDAQLRSASTTLVELLGTQRRRVPSGVAIGMYDQVDEVVEAARSFVDEGYSRVKLKIQPGWDIDPVAAVRAELGPGAAIQVDGNGAYRRNQIDHLRQLDEFGLLMVEQPFPADDLVSHARLSTESSTPVCLDESISSLQTVADAIELGAASIINIKPGRVGGILAARSIHDYCHQRSVPVWCGGMLETGIGRAANVGLATLPGFSLAGDLSGSDRFYQRDIVTNPIRLNEGDVEVPDGDGMGFVLDAEYLDSVTVSRTVLPR